MSANAKLSESEAFVNRGVHRGICEACVHKVGKRCKIVFGELRDKDWCVHYAKRIRRNRRSFFENR